MFERYNEAARRALFFARWEAEAVGATQIDTEHLLLGIIRQDDAESRDLLEKLRVNTDAIVARYPHVTEVRTSADMALTEEAKAILARAVEEADARGARHRAVLTLRWGTT